MPETLALSKILALLSFPRRTQCERPVSNALSVFREAPREAGREPLAFALFSLLALPNHGCPRNTGTRPVRPRIPWFTRLPPVAPPSLPRASMRVNQACPAPFTAPVRAPMAATAPRLVTTAIAPSARAPAAARTSPPRSVFCRRRRRGPPMRRCRYPQPSRRPRFSARVRGLRFLPGSLARLQS
jgi:hypothetical protein